MSKIKFNEDSVPATLTEGAFVVVDGVAYVGNSSNEPVSVANEYLELSGSLTRDSGGNYTSEINVNGTGLSPTFSDGADGTIQVNLSNDNIVDRLSAIGGGGAQNAGGDSDNFIVYLSSIAYTDPSSGGNGSFIKFKSVNIVSGSRGYSNTNTKVFFTIKLTS